MLAWISLFSRLSPLVLVTQEKLCFSVIKNLLINVFGNIKLHKQNFAKGALLSTCLEDSELAELIRNYEKGADEMAQRRRALTAVPKQPGLIASTHTADDNHLKLQGI